MEAEFSLTNSRVQVSPTQLAWRRFAIPQEGSGIDFHIYVADKSTENEVFCNNDDHILVFPLQGRLDIQTEFGEIQTDVGFSGKVTIDRAKDDGTAGRAGCDSARDEVQG